MPFKPGVSGNKAGRPKGVPNKTTGTVKRLVEGLILNNAGDIKQQFKWMTGKDKVKAFCDLLPYVVPRLQNTALDIEIEKLSDEQLDELYAKIMSSVKM